MNLNKFLEQNNNLVIGTDVTSHYQLIHLQTEEVWGTFKSPAEAEDVDEITREISEGLPLGTNHFRLQAVTAAGVIRAQTNLAVEGRSSVAKKTGNTTDPVQLTRAFKMNVDTAEQQLTTMTARLQELEKREFEAQSRATAMATEGFKMMDLVHRLMNSKEEEQRAAELHEARMNNVKAVGMMLLPLLQPFIKIAETAMKTKVSEWEEKAKGSSNSKGPN